MSAIARAHERNAASSREGVFAVRLAPAVKRALGEAAERAYESKADYLRRSLVQRLRDDGLLPELPASGRAAPALEMPSTRAAATE